MGWMFSPKPPACPPPGGCVWWALGNLVLQGRYRTRALKLERDTPLKGKGGKDISVRGQHGQGPVWRE